MIAINNELQTNETNWQTTFVTMLPEIQQRLRRAFRHLDAEAPRGRGRRRRRPQLAQLLPAA